MVVGASRPATIWLSCCGVRNVEGMTSTSSDDDTGRDGDPTATASSGPVGRPDDAKVPYGDDTLEEILARDRPSGHILAPDQDVSDDDT